MIILYFNFNVKIVIEPLGCYRVRQNGDGLMQESGKIKVKRRRVFFYKIVFLLDTHFTKHYYF